MSNGVIATDMFRHSVTFIDRILKGAKPGDLPVEQPARFEMIVNLKTASALGITVPQALLLRADEVIRCEAPVALPLAPPRCSAHESKPLAAMEHSDEYWERKYPGGGPDFGRCHLHAGSTPP